MIILAIVLGLRGHPSRIKSHFFSLGSCRVLQYRRVIGIIVRIFVPWLLESLLAPAFGDVVALADLVWSLILKLIASRLDVRGLSEFASHWISIINAILGL